METASPSALNPETVKLPARFDAAAAEEMESSVLLAVKIGAHDMVVDASDTSYMTAAGMRALLCLARELKAAGGKLSICNLQPQAKELYEACGFGWIIPAYSQSAAAVAQIAA